MTSVNTPDGSNQTPERSGLTLWNRIARTPTTAIFIVSLVMAVFVLYVTGALDGVVDALGSANVWLLLVTAPIYVTSLWVLAFRWHMLVHMAGGTSNLPRAAEAFLTSVIINYAAPIGLAVPSRAALTKRALGLDASQTGTIALWEIAFDVVVLGTGTVLWMLLAEGALGEVRAEIGQSAQSYLLAGIALIAVLMVVTAVIARKPALRTKVQALARRVLVAPTRRPLAAIQTILITLTYWTLQGLVLWLIITALRVDVSLDFMIGFTSLPILVGMLSPIPGGAAVREGLMYVVARMSELASSADAILAAALIYRFALFGAIPVLFVVNRIWLNRQHHNDSLHQNERMPTT